MQTRRIAMSIVVTLALPARADVSREDATSIRARRLADAASEGAPLLHLDPATFDGVAAEGVQLAHDGTVVDLGTRARLVIDGRWWQTGLSPTAFVEDHTRHGWRASAELSYDLGVARLGTNVSIARAGDVEQRSVGLFAARTFRLSRWMHAWIAVGVGFEEWRDTRTQARTRGMTGGLTLGTTFR